MSRGTGSRGGAELCHLVILRCRKCWQRGRVASLAAVVANWSFRAIGGSAVLVARRFVEMVRARCVWCGRPAVWLRLSSCWRVWSWRLVDRGVLAGRRAVLVGKGVVDMGGVSGLGWRSRGRAVVLVAAAVLLAGVVAGCGASARPSRATAVVQRSADPAATSRASVSRGSAARGGHRLMSERARSLAAARALADLSRAVRPAVGRRSPAFHPVTSKQAGVAQRRVAVLARRARQRARVLVKDAVAADPERCLAKAGALASGGNKPKQLTRAQGERERVIVLRCISAAVRAGRASRAGKSRGPA